MIDTSFLYSTFNHPLYIIEEDRLRHNLQVIRSVAQEADIDIILAFKAFALWKTFPIFREYINASTASSINEVLLSSEAFDSTHTYSPAYTDYDIETIAQKSSHLTFNSLTQYKRYFQKAKEINPNISLGIRINPEYSEISTELYNPCAAGTRFGISEERMPEELPEEIEGFHCHCHCENNSETFARTLEHIEKHFHKWFANIKWINFGGGHLMTHKDYDKQNLITTLKQFHEKYPHLKLYMEPGSAFVWQTGVLIAQVVDIVTDNNITTAILNVSFTCHMPDCLEMPYMPAVRGAEIIDNPSSEEFSHSYRLGGCSCLAGDYLGYWKFDHELSVGETIIFEDMIHYTTVKTNMFNGISHPSLAILRSSGEVEILREYGFEDYKMRMD